MDRLFLDANVLFSSAYRSNAGLARLWELRNVELVTSHYAAEEARVNLAERDQLHRLQGLLERVQIVAELAPLPSGLKLPEKDQLIVQAALACAATHLLTGDKRHFGKYYGRRIGGVLILPPAAYFQGWVR